MTPAEMAFLARMEARSGQLTPTLRRLALEAYRVIRDSLSHAELERYLADGSVEKLISALLGDDRTDPALVSLRVRIEQALLDAARAEAGALPSFIRPTTFDVLHPAIISAARDMSHLAISSLREEIRDTVRDAVMRGLEEGINPRQVAREVRASIGLSPQQERYVANFRRELETSDRSALRRVLGKGVIQTPGGERIRRPGHASGEGVGLTSRQVDFLDRSLGTSGIPRDRIDAYVDAYRRRLIALNADAHAKTASLQAMKVGQRQAWEDAVRRGIVLRTDLIRRWRTVGDSRVRPEHRDLHGVEVGFDDPFPNGEMIPGDSTWNCRCLAYTFLARRTLTITRSAA